MKNFLFTILTLFIFILIFFSSLNYFLGGVPLFNIFNINITQAVYVSKDENLKKDYEISLSQMILVLEAIKTNYFIIPM